MDTLVERLPEQEPWPVTHETVARDVQPLADYFADRDRSFLEKIGDLSGVTRGLDRLTKPLPGFLHRHQTMQYALEYYQRVAEAEKKGTGYTIWVREIDDLVLPIAALQPEKWREAAAEADEPKAKGLSRARHLGIYFEDKVELALVTDLVPILGRRIYAKKARAAMEEVVGPEEDDHTLVEGYADRVFKAIYLVEQYRALEVLKDYRAFAPVTEAGQFRTYAQRFKTINASKNPVLGKLLQQGSLIDDVNSYVQARVATEMREEEAESYLGQLGRYESARGRASRNLNVVSTMLWGQQLQQLGAVMLRGTEAGRVNTTSAADDRRAQERERLATDHARRQAEVAATRQTESELLQDVTERLRDADSANTELQSPWRLSKQEVKRRGLSEAIGAFVKGVRNGAGTLLVHGQSKTTAHALVGQLEYLRKLGSSMSVEELQELFKTIYGQEDELRERVDQAYSDAQQLPSHLQTRLVALKPQIVCTRDMVQSLESQWPSVQHVLKTRWPQKAQATSAVRTALSASTSAMNNSTPPQKK